MASRSADRASSRSIGSIFRERVPAHGAREALKSRRDGKWQATTWTSFFEKVQALALALDSIGLARGDRMAILANTREEWTLLDTAAACVGIVTVGIYQSELPDRVHYILEDCDAKVCFVEDAKQLAKVDPKKLAKLERVAGIQADGIPPGGLGFEALLEKGRALLAKHPKKFDQLVDPVKGSDLATLVYTSGTTGMPKGAMLTHANFTETCESTRGVLGTRTTDRTVLFLPLAHIFSRIIQAVCIEQGLTLVYPPYGFTPDVLFQVFVETRPTFIPSVPRIFEKVYTAASAQFAAVSGPKRRIVDFALSVGTKVSRLKQQGRRPGALLKLQHAVADRLVFSKVKNRFGGEVRFFISGGAPLAKEIAEWFHALDLLVLEGYGLTETTAASCVNRPEHYRFGTVGPANPGTEIRIAEDGEILIRGTSVFQGYFKRPEETAQVIDPQGWFATGDIGEIDPDGFLKITDRKKDLIITAGGKNIAPAYVEGKLKTIPLVSQVIVHGDRRKFLSALVTLNPDEVKKLGLSYEDAVASPKVREILEKEIADRNKQLESYQQVKKFAILEHDFSIESGELTPSLKVKRKAVSEKYKLVLDRFYVESADSAA